MAPLSVVVVYNKSNQFGLSKDADLLATYLPQIAREKTDYKVSPVKLMDCREAPVVCDICIHLEQPYAVWFPWARANVLLVNPEWWLPEKWSDYLDNFDVIMTRDTLSCNMFKEDTVRHVVTVPWYINMKQPMVSQKDLLVRKDEFVWFLGGSVNKRRAAELILPLWKESYPPLSVYSLEPLAKTDHLPSNIKCYTGFLDQKVRDTIARTAKGHICASVNEAFGYTAMEATALGAFVILNVLDVYCETYEKCSFVGWLPEEFNNKDEYSRALEKAIEKYRAANFEVIQNDTDTFMKSQYEKFQNGIAEMLNEAAASIKRRPAIPKHMPPLLNPQDCPPISIITLSHNRPQFIQNACLNLLSSDYPRDKIEWVVVDDSEADQSASNRIIQFKEQFAPGTVTYVPLARERSIGYKRNLGVERAKHDILLMMDDDDHYPSTSFRRRVAYLTKGREQADCSVCTTIAMYDLLKGVSAVNVPPYTLSLAERCSEATLTFTRDFWKQRKFEDVSVAEGEAFLKGRTSRVVEMPPQQIIVALTHGKNVSSRSMPNAGAGCFWGFPRELLYFLHGLAGVKVEEA